MKKLNVLYLLLCAISPTVYAADTLTVINTSTTTTVKKTSTLTVTGKLTSELQPNKFGGGQFIKTCRSGTLKAEMWYGPNRMTNLSFDLTGKNIAELRNDWNNPEKGDEVTIKYYLEDADCQLADGVEQDYFGWQLSNPKVTSNTGNLGTDDLGRATWRPEVVQKQTSATVYKDMDLRPGETRAIVKEVSGTGVVTCNKIDDLRNGSRKITLEVSGCNVRYETNDQTEPGVYVGSVQVAIAFP